MNDTIERSVTTNRDQELYVITEASGGYSCLGFDVCLDRIDRITTELVGRRAMPEQFIDGTVLVERGSLGAYDTYRALEAQLIKVCREQGERALYDLTPQLIGLEGKQVEVIDRWDERRSFVVGKSTGPIPIHLEVEPGRDGGAPASREYKKVRVIG